MLPGIHEYIHSDVVPHFNAAYQQLLDSPTRAERYTHGGDSGKDTEGRRGDTAGRWVCEEMEGKRRRKKNWAE